MKQEFRIPLTSEVKNRKELFVELNEFVRARNGWITSVPGAVDVAIETLPGSTLPDELRKNGYDPVETGDGQRIIPHAIVEAVITEGSTRVAYRTTHAGIVGVHRFKFTLP